MIFTKHLSMRLRLLFASFLFGIAVSSVVFSAPVVPTYITKNQAAEQVVDAYANTDQIQVLKVEQVVFNGRQAYRVKALSEKSKVLIVYVNAISGALLP